MDSKFRIDIKQPKVRTATLRREHTAALLRTERKNKRDDIYNQQRLDHCVEGPEANRPVIDLRAVQMEAWKKSREEAEKNSKKKSKPFIVGAVRHNVGSPYKKQAPFKADTHLPIKSSKKQIFAEEQASLKQIVAAGRVTRAMTRAAKLNETVTVKKRKVLPKLAPTNFKFKAPEGIAPLPFGNTQARDLQVVLSPFAVKVTKTGEQEESVFIPSGVAKRSGGKESTKTSSVKNKSESPLRSKRKLDYVSPEQNKELLLVEAVHLGPKTDVSHYRKELNTVIEQLENLCNKWSFTQEQSASLPNEVNDMVDVATGQTKLLIKEKLAQYRGLIDECEKNCDSIRITESDLQGFWEMVNLQVQNVISKFERLDVLKDNNWAEPKKQQTSPLKKKKKGVAKISKPKPVAAKSSVRDHIAALRRAKAAIQSNEPKTPHVASSISVDSTSRGGKTQPNHTGNSTPVVVLIRTQLSEKQNKNRRCSAALMKITNQLKEICTPETASKVNTAAVNSSRRVSNRMEHFTPGVLNIGKKPECDAVKTPAGRKRLRRSDSGEIPRDMFSTTVILKDCHDMLKISQSPIEDKRKNKNSEDNALKNVNVSPVSAKNKENLFHDNEVPYITPPNKTYSKSPMKSTKLLEEERQFELLKKTPTFVHRSPASEKPKEMSSKDTPRARRQ